MHKNKNILDATGNALNGIKELIQEKSARRELLLIVLSVSFFCYKPNVYTVLIAVLSLVLLAVEALNTALEKTCDLITVEQHPEIKKIKDLGAAAVFIIVLTIALIFIRYLSPFF
ncbi:diacylglycerol kinase [Polynucleobacter sp. UK-Kesae-W10]|uniref:diacylglycerol kinase n=1 Tax=Polynucleobacter sp. UK-Kesae-W10 TaxID=1819738 RepID=UPI001C0C63DA|nr:diacylglycerol kinase [Polynucleobacter sp. UK-Kesae-W10]MBU3577832.1 diacylglycerol kinase [Polynucleobacter sp. UK-Kesae-W10]